MALQNSIISAFAASGQSVSLRAVSRGSKVRAAAQQAIDDGCELIVAAGGDGTICSVAEAALGSNRRLGILPLGTFNYFARSLDIPDDLEQAVSIIMTGVLKDVRVAAINDRLFLNNASMGAYPAILKTREELYRRWGRSRIAAYWSVLKTLVTLRHPLKIDILAEGQRVQVRTPLVFAINNAYQLDEIGLSGSDAIAQGKMILLTAPDSGRWGMLKHAFALATRSAVKRRDFNMIAADDITITPTRKVHRVARDGERDRMRGPFRLRILPESLHVMTPQHRQDTIR